MATGSQFDVDRHKIIDSIMSPLGFFALALLIVEAFLIAAGTLFNLPESQRVLFVWTGIGLFLVLVVIVTVMVIRWPRNLVFTDVSHIRYAKLCTYGTERQVAGPSKDVVSLLPNPSPPEQQSLSINSGAIKRLLSEGGKE